MPLRKYKTPCGWWLTCSIDKISCCCGSHHSSYRLYTCTSYLSPFALLSERKPYRSSNRHPRSACVPRPDPRTPYSYQPAEGTGLSLLWSCSVGLTLFWVIDILAWSIFLNIPHTRCGPTWLNMHLLSYNFLWLLNKFGFVGSFTFYW